MSHTVQSDNGKRVVLSPLAIDMAKSVVTMAALKLQAGMELDEEERESAWTLKEHFTSRQRYSLTTNVSESVIPEKSLRHELEEALATLRPDSGEVPEEKRIEVERAIVKMLDKLVTQTVMNETDVATLLDLLDKMDEQNQEDVNLPRVQINGA